MNTIGHFIISFQVPDEAQYNWGEGILFMLIAFITFCFSVFIAGTILALISYVVYRINYGIFLKRQDTVLSKFRLNASELSILSQEPFYLSLNETQRRRFETKVARIISMKRFEGRENLVEITAELKVKVAAIIARLTLGWNHIYLIHFKDIVFYAKSYYSKLTNTYNHGEVHSSGAIVLSVEKLMKGTEKHKNLGIHEVAHALYLENKTKNNEYQFINPKYFKKTEENWSSEIQKVESGQPSIFREYGLLNKVEFFAVVSEVFFTSPLYLLENSPNLYEWMIEVYNQDPVNNLYPINKYMGTPFINYFQEIYGFKKSSSRNF